MLSRSQTSSPISVVLTTNPPSVVITPNPPLVRVPIPSTSGFIGTHSASNSNRVTSVVTGTDPPSAALPQISSQIHPSPIKPPCHFYMQGSCKHGKRGNNCIFPHPPMCFKFIGKGSKWCNKGSLCTYAHLKLCQTSVSNRRCNRKNIYNFYHVSSSLRPNHPGTALEKHSDNKLEKGHSLTPLMQTNCQCMRRDPNYLHSHPIPYTQVNQPNPVFISSPLFPLIKHSHPPSQQSHLPTPALQQPSFDGF